MKNLYKARVIDRIIEEKLEGIGAIVIEGPKWCGKTTTAEQFASSILYMDNPAEVAENKRIAEVNPSLLLEGKVPRLIDEWQIAPQLWDAVRFTVDRRKEEGLFILTGSSSPLSEEDKKKIHHTGTGRIVPIKMHTMSLFESGESNGSVSLSKLFEDDNIEGISDLTLPDIAYLTCRGGWPRAALQNQKSALGRAFDYIDAIAEKDISKVDGVERDPARTRLLLRSYARLQGAQAPVTTIRDDLKPNDSQYMNEDTISSYINALKKIFVIEDVDAWNPNLVSKTAIRTSDTRYFTDPSIATAALGANPDALIKNLSAFGLLFEALCIRDLRVYAQATGGSVSHYKDKNGLECDAVVHLRDGSYGLIEIKLGGETLIEEGAKSLKKLASLLDYGMMKRPAFLMVLTANSRYAYKRKDGVLEVPIACLAP